MDPLLLPKKPSNVTWTDDQWKAIYAKDQDILVAAAAGSGKTAVLVERIIQKIVDQTNPLDVDRLLVVTFTNASAAEMRHRIGEALEKTINEQPTSQHLRRQLTLLNKANISTLHSFCLEVIRKYYYYIDIDPGFRIADSTEIQLLRDEVMDELFEQQYSIKDNDRFYQLIDAYTSDRNDEALQKIVSELYDFSRSNPDPDRWLHEIMKMYDVHEDGKVEDASFIKPLILSIQLKLTGAKDLFERGLSLTKEPGGPAPRADNFLEDLALVENFIAGSETSWETLYEAMSNWNGSLSRAKVCRGDEYDKLLVERAQKLREKGKDLLKELKDSFFTRKPENYLRDMTEMKNSMESLVHLVSEFGTQLEQVKKEKGLVDFADLEHFCLSILTKEVTEHGQRIPSDAAHFYREYFQEVLVDEYQDVNMVQESILKLVTNENESTGNMFMVGDVKQSIVRP